LAAQLIERYGVLTREMVAAEGVVGSFSGLYPILKAMEEAGKIRRGYFVAGLGAAQFAAPGAEDRLRDMWRVVGLSRPDGINAHDVSARQRTRAW
jgi:ATP-dependent Lhr-like helicase